MNPANVPPTPALVSKIVSLGKSTSAFVPNAILQAMISHSDSEKLFEPLNTLENLIWHSSPCDALVSRRKLQDYVPITDFYEIIYEESPDPKVSVAQFVFHNHSLDDWPLKDLHRHSHQLHPSRSRQSFLPRPLSIFHSTMIPNHHHQRQPDKPPIPSPTNDTPTTILLLSTGTPINPLPFEAIVSSHPSVTAAILTSASASAGRTKVAWLVEFWDPPARWEIVKQRELIREVWPRIEEANQGLEVEARAKMADVVLTVPTKPMVRGGKGGVERGRTVDAYREELVGVWEVEE